MSDDQQKDVSGKVSVSEEDFQRTLEAIRNNSSSTNVNELKGKLEELRGRLEYVASAQEFETMLGKVEILQRIAATTHTSIMTLDKTRYASHDDQKRVESMLDLLDLINVKFTILARRLDLGRE